MLWDLWIFYEFADESREKNHRISSRAWEYEKNNIIRREREEEKRMKQNIEWEQEDFLIY